MPSRDAERAELPGCMQREAMSRVEVERDAPPRVAPIQKADVRLAHRRDVVLRLIGSQLAARYRQSALGWVWAIAPPFAQLLVFWFVFTRILPVETDFFLVFLFTGIVAWNWLATSLVLAAASIEAHRDLALRPGFPPVLLPIVAVCVAAVDYLLTLPILLVAIVMTVGVSPSLLILPLILAVQLCLTTGLACLVAPLNVLFRDVGHLLGLVLLLGFFGTPVFYSLDQVPARFSLVYDLNPMAQLIEAQRTIFIDQTPPDLSLLSLTALSALIVLGGGLAVFRRLKHTFPDYM